MNAAARSALSTLTATLRTLGFEAHVDSRRSDKRRPGYQARFLAARGIRAGLFIFGDRCAAGEFERLCAALVSAGYSVEDAAGGTDYVTRGCARVTPPTA